MSRITISIIGLVLVLVGLIVFASLRPFASNPQNLSGRNNIAQAPSVPSPNPTDVIYLTPPPSPVTPIPSIEVTPFIPPPTPLTPLPTITPLVTPYTDPEFDTTPTAVEASNSSRPTHAPSDPKVAVLYAEQVSDIPVSTNTSDLIVIATVKKVGPARWTTPDGKRPVNPWASDNIDYIYTPITIVIQEQIVNKARLNAQAGTELHLKGYGGVVGKDSLSWGGDDLFQFIEGDKVLVFLARPQGLVHPEIDKAGLLEVYDRFTITKDNEAVNSYHKLPLDQVLSQIQTVIQP